LSAGFTVKDKTELARLRDEFDGIAEGRCQPPGRLGVALSWRRPTGDPGISNFWPKLSSGGPHHVLAHRVKKSTLMPHETVCSWFAPAFLQSPTSADATEKAFGKRPNIGHDRRQV